MKRLDGKIAWVTGAGAGGGGGAARGLAREGAKIVLTGRREAPLEDVARRIKSAGGTASVKPGDLMQPATARRIADGIKREFGRLDILVNNAGLNIAKRSWRQLEESGADETLHGNLSSAFYCVIAALPIMRVQQDGVLIHTASWAARFVSPLSGPAYTSAKPGLLAMSPSINGEECMNGIRS